MKKISKKLRPQFVSFLKDFKDITFSVSCESNCPLAEFFRSRDGVKTKDVSVGSKTIKLVIVKKDKEIMIKLRHRKWSRRFVRRWDLKTHDATGKAALRIMKNV